MQKNLKKYGWLFLLPTAVAFLFAFAAPFVLGVGLSFIIFETEMVPFPENSSHRWCVTVRLLTLPCCHRSIQTMKFMAT